MHYNGKITILDLKHESCVALTCPKLGNPHFYIIFDTPEMYFAMCSVLRTCEKLENVDHLYVGTINFKLLEEDLKFKVALQNFAFVVMISERI